MELNEILRMAIDKKASDILIITGLPVSLKIAETIVRLNDKKLTSEMTEAMVRQIYGLANRPFNKVLAEQGDDDFSFSVAQLSRFRVNAFRQRGSYSAVVRALSFELPDRLSLGIPDAVIGLSDRKKGLVLVTGPAGSGKSTTLACMVDHINKTRSSHIITIEDPIEYLHRHNRSVVTQRELSVDTLSYDAALRAAMRQAPNVILLGEMRDYDTMRAALTAAETGHLVISTLHTTGAASTIDRIVDAFLPSQQPQVRIQLSMILQGVVSQQLIPKVGSGVAPAFEIMIVNSAIRTMIREGKTHQIDSVIYAGRSEGMTTMDASICELVEKGKISVQNAEIFSINPEQTMRRLQK
jgi:twitching motility protein PilT